MRRDPDDTPPICECGCGEPVRDKRNGVWARWRQGHHLRKSGGDVDVAPAPPGRGRVGMRACAFCGNPVQGHYRRVTGWERVRGGGAGGLNKLLQRTETGEHACDECGYAIAHGVEPGTPALF